MVMSLKKYILISCSVAFFGFVTGAGVYYFNNSPSRNPASMLPPPQAKKGHWHTESSGFVGKPQRTMNVSITAVHGIPASNSQEIVLRADVTLLQSLGPDVEYKWILPKDAVIVEGNLDDVWQNLQPGQSVSVEISLLNVSRETPKTIVFQAFGLVNGARMGGSTAFTTAATSAVSDEEMTTSQKMNADEVSEKKAEALKNIQQ